MSIMKRILLLIGIVLGLIGSNDVFTQAREGVRYEKGFKMKDGIYLSADQFRNNTPIENEKVLAGIDPNDPEFVNKVTDKKSFQLISAGGTKMQIETNTLYGYAYNGVPYLRVDNSFYRVVLVGELCYFAVPIVNTGASGPRIGLGIGTYGAGVGVSVPIGGNNQVTTKEIIVDTSTGKIADLNPETLTKFIEDDQELSQRYLALKNRKRKKLMHEYIKMYNDSNPLYFPE